MRQWAGRIKHVFFGPHAGDSEQVANGFAVATIGLQCTGERCQAAELVSNGQEFWDLLVISKSAKAVNDFLDSFQPIG